MVVRPSVRAPKLDIRGVRDTISNRRRLCEVGRKCRNIRTNPMVRAIAKTRNSGVTDPMTTMDETQARDNIATF
jgi:hypothetical protein